MGGSCKVIAGCGFNSFKARAASLGRRTRAVLHKTCLPLNHQVKKFLRSGDFVGLGPREKKTRGVTSPTGLRQNIGRPKRELKWSYSDFQYLQTDAECPNWNFSSSLQVRGCKLSRSTLVVIFNKANYSGPGRAKGEHRIVPKSSSRRCFIYFPARYQG